ncbi:MAG: ribosome maturation factor RimP [Ruminococcus sp.]|nr:ribosome maturation factor RimP [Ruminococcus sp.]
MAKDNKSKGNSVCDIVREIAQPVAESCSVDIWDIRYVKEGAQWYLRIFIDKEGGVSVDDCEAVSRAIDEPLDRLDPIKDYYILEVSSPGLERELVRMEHFDRFIGADIMVRLIRPMEVLGRDFSGVLTSHDKDTVTITDHSGENVVTINKKDAAWIKLDDFG